MRLFDLSRALFQRHRHTCIAVVFILLEAAFCAFFLIKKGIHPEDGFLGDARTMLKMHGFVPSAAYPPLLPSVLYLLMRISGAETVNILAFHAFGFVLSAVCFYGFLKQLALSANERLGVFIAAFLNPYFVWLSFVSKDTSYEACWLFLFFTIAYRLVSKGVPGASLRNLAKPVALLTLVATLGFLTRLTVFFATLVSCVLFVFVTRDQVRKTFLLTLACLAGAGLLFASFNAARSGAFNLSTTVGLDVFYGNHPLYDYAHPRHDIDIFLPYGLNSEDAYSRKNNELLLKQGLEFIRQDPATFAARILEKTVWHWFNFEKIPNLSTHTRLVSHKGNVLTLEIDRVEHVSGMLYELYKLIYIPAGMFAALVIVASKRRFWTEAVLVGPLVSLWPIVVLTFPDTRFKITGELLLIPCIYLACRYGIHKLHNT